MHGWVGNIYVANDHTPNYLWYNEAEKGFTDRGVMSGTAFSQSGEATVSMSVDYADFNDEVSLTCLYRMIPIGAPLYENRGKRTFADRGISSNISMRQLSV
jgi:hypothetical protein